MSKLRRETISAVSPEQTFRRCVLTIPVGQSELPLIGSALKMYVSDMEVWQIVADSNITEATLAKMLGLLTLDAEEVVLHQQLMPLIAPSAHFLKNGQIRQGRGFFLAPWVLEEVNRLAGILQELYPTYLTDVKAALNQAYSKNFGPLPAGLIFTDTLHSARLGPPPPSIAVDLSQSERVRYNLQSHQVLAQDYVRNPYLALLSDEELSRRVEDIMSNLHIIDENGLVSLDSQDPYVTYWMARLTEIQVQMQMRHGPYPAGWKRGMIDFANMPGSLNTSGRNTAFKLIPSAAISAEYLVKYGKREFLEPALKEGTFRIAPASLYNDSSLNTAIRDDELSAEIFYDPTVPFNDVPPGTIIFPTGRVPHRQRSESNYYVFCLADRLSTRLLLDFEGDACLLIRDPDTFISRVEEAMRRTLPNWRFIAKEVRYFDPLQVNPAELDVLVNKHFRYAYQREVRFAWLPDRAQQRLEPIFITLGSLEDIAELIVPSTTGANA